MNNKETLLLKGEIATREHIQDVNTLLLWVAKDFLDRAIYHDKSKLSPEEHEKFSLAATKFKEPGNEFGTKGYEKTKEWLGSALRHHYEHNSHHPEHYENGLSDMNLFDLLEMLIDWTAASAKRSETGILDFSIAQKQHGLSDELLKIFINTADYFNIRYKV